MIKEKVKSKRKNVWIINQYATSPSSGNWGRHYEISKNIQNEYNPTIIAGSYLSQYVNNKIKNPLSTLIEEESGVKFRFVWNNRYRGNGFLRILSMFTFTLTCVLTGLIVSKQNKPEYIVASSVHPLAWLAGFILSKWHKSELILETRDLWPKSLVDYEIASDKNIIIKLMYRYERFMYRKASKLVFTMEGGHEYIEDKGIFKNLREKPRVFYINNGVNINHFEELKTANAFDDSDLMSKRFKIIYAGSIRKVNNIDLLLDVAKKIINKNVNFLIYGNGNYVNHIKRRIDDENINNVKYKGFIEKKYIPFVLSCSDLNIITGETKDVYKYGMSINKLFEYLAAGKPILSTYLMGYSIIRSHNCGKEFDINEEQEKIIDFINQISFKNKEYDSYCINAKNTAKEYDYLELSRKFIMMLKE